MAQQPELQLLSRANHRPPPLAASIGSEVLEACSAATLQLGGPTLKSLGITSAIRGEGRTTVAIAMAMIQRRDYSRRTLLLEMDVDNPTLAGQLGVDQWPGLTQLIRGEAALKDVVHPFADDIAAVTMGAGAGAAPRTVIDFLRSGVLQDLGREFDVLVGDLPPLLDSNFGHLLAGAFERVVLVVRAGATPVGRIREATAALASEPAVLLNGVESPLPRWIQRIIRS
jgi:Mrp family chromosome partitioning ATPase